METVLIIYCQLWLLRLTGIRGANHILVGVIRRIPALAGIEAPYYSCMSRVNMSIEHLLSHHMNNIRRIDDYIRPGDPTEGTADNGLILSHPLII